MSANTVIHTEQALFGLIAGGDTAAFRELFDLYVPRLQPVVAGIIENESHVKDILQEVFLLLWTGREKLAGVESPRNWIFKTMYFQCYKYLRQQAVRSKAQEKMLSELKGQPLLNQVEEYTSFEETSKLIREAVNGLPSQAQKIYRLRREQDMPIADIAEQLNIAPKTVKNSLTRSLDAIRSHLEENGIVVPLFLLAYWML